MHTKHSYSYRRFFVSAAMLMLGSPAYADLTFVGIEKNIVYKQTSLGSNPIGYFIYAGARMQSPGDFDMGMLAYPGANSPVQLILSDDGTSLGYSTGWINEGEFNFEYGGGVYTFDVANSLSHQTGSASIYYFEDAYSAEIPALTQDSFTALQGVNTESPITINFNAFTPYVTANEAFTFLRIYDSATSSSVYTADFLDPSSTSVTLPSGTLLAGRQYNYELIFDGRILGNDNNVATFQLFDLRTSGEFITAVPEPEIFSMFLVGLGLVGTLAHWRKLGLK